MKIATRSVLAACSISASMFGAAVLPNEAPMKLLQGEFGPTTNVTWSTRWFWLRRNLSLLIPTRRPPGDTGQGHTVRRECGAWVVRPRRGWRRVRYISPPTLYTRGIPASDEDGAVDWALERMGM